MTGADKVMNPQHFWSSLADIWIQIWINAEIQIQNLDHFWLRLDAWQRFTVLLFLLWLLLLLLKQRFDTVNSCAHNTVVS